MDSHGWLKMTFPFPTLNRFPRDWTTTALWTSYWKLAALSYVVLNFAFWVGLRAVCTLKDSPWTLIIFVLFDRMSSLDSFVTIVVGKLYLLKRARFQVDLLVLQFLSPFTAIICASDCQRKNLPFCCVIGENVQRNNHSNIVPVIRHQVLGRSICKVNLDLRMNGFPRSGSRFCLSAG